MQKLLLALFLLAGLSRVAEAYPSRARLLIHGKLTLSNRLGLSAHLTPAPNLVDGLAPLAFLELNIQATKWLEVSPTIGWAFKPDEVITSLRLRPHFQRFWGWLDFELRPQSYAGYWFVQAEYRVLPWLELGIEEESWGNFTKFEAMSHGGGPNLLLRLGEHLRFDFVLHARAAPPAGIGPDFFLRVHLFF